MSEYQYLEFQAIDRPLGEADQKALRALSSRARITRTSFTNHYEWGDFKGEPKKLMERYFDLHLYLADWGMRRLMIRLPKRLVDLSLLDPFLRDVDGVKIWTSGESLIVDIVCDEVESNADDWDDGSGWLAALAPLRLDLLSGDLRLFYLLWLAAIKDDGIDDGATEPLSGIGPLSGALETFAQFFAIDPDFLQTAAELPVGFGAGANTSDVMREGLAAMPEREKTDFLLRLVEDDLHAIAELKGRARALSAQPSTGPRTVGALRARATAIRRARERVEAERLKAERRRKDEEVEQQRRARLDDVKRRGVSVWNDIEAEIERRNASGYEAAAGLLFDLKSIAADQGTLTDFARRVQITRERHARKGKFIERVKGLTAR